MLPGGRHDVLARQPSVMRYAASASRRLAVLHSALCPPPVTLSNPHNEYTFSAAPPAVNNVQPRAALTDDEEFD